RIGSALDPIIRLMDAQGRELVYSDDTPGLMGDCQLSHTFAAPGEYVLEVRDIRYQGGGNFIFRLRIGDFPLLNVPYPLAIKRGAEAKLEVAGPDLEGVQPVTVKAPTEPHARAT